MIQAWPAQRLCQHEHITIIGRLVLLMTNPCEITTVNIILFGFDLFHVPHFPRGILVAPRRTGLIPEFKLETVRDSPIT